MKRYLPWLIAVLITLLGITGELYRPVDTRTGIDYISDSLFVLATALIAFVGALIVVRQGGNRVGWLMVVTAAAFANPSRILLNFYPSQPTHLTPGLWLALWVESWIAIAGIASIFLILLHFPDGRPPSPRWNWINAVALITLLLAAFLPVLSDQIGPIDGSWNMDNPLGLFPKSVVEYSYITWVIGLLIIGGGSLASLFYRFRRGGYVERQQIKWLLYAGAMILVAVGLLYFLPAFSIDPYTAGWPLFFGAISIMILPLAIGNAILRYRLYDIDIIIRRTLVYGALSAILVLVYFGAVTLLQNLLSGITGQQSTVAIVISTLAIAALFSPLRRRIQDVIDRRFYRRKYSADQILVSFAADARDEVDIERLAGSLLGVVEETMQPDHLSLWLKDES